MQEDPTLKVSRKNRTLRWPFWLWLTGVLLIVLLFTVIAAAKTVQRAIAPGYCLSPAQTEWVTALSDISGLVFLAARQLGETVDIDPLPLLMEKKTVEQPQWLHRFPAAEDTGYLLFSGVDSVAKRSVVQLIRISDGLTVAQWSPDWPAIFAHQRTPPAGGLHWARAIHPLLLADGDIVFNTSSAMVRMSICSTAPVWVIDEELHHSNEFDATGDTIWTPAVAQDGLIDNSWLGGRVRDDALASVSLDGRILEKRSFIRILRENGFQALLFGTSGFGNQAEDPIHLNEIQIASKDSRHWKRGDLLISARHLSTVFLYRPSTGKIFWHSTGPWMNQHSVEFVDDHRISVFDNNIIRGVPNERAFLTAKDNNRVLVYDFDTARISEPFAAMLAETRPLSITEGRARILPDGGLFLEESNYGRHLRFTRDHLLWSRINHYDEQRVGLLSWSRYLTADEARAPLQSIASRTCATEAIPQISRIGSKE